MGISILGDLISPIKDLVSEAIVDKDKRDQINLQLQVLADQADVRIHEETMAQIGVNNAEAQNKSMFVAGWRPFIGWVGGVGVGWTFVLSPFVGTIASFFGWHGTLPQLDSGQLMTLVLAMLGIGGYRTYEKVKGVGSDTMREPVTVNQAAPAATREDQTILDQLHQAIPAIPEKAPWA
jgi:hypothetical protein